MTLAQNLHVDLAVSLAQSLVVSSNTPLILLDSDLVVIAVSDSFCRAFVLDPVLVTGSAVLAMGDGEWDLPRLKSLLDATGSGGSDIEKYEMDLTARGGRGTRSLELSAHKLNYDDAANIRILLSVVDTTDARAAEKVKDGLIADKVLLMQELQHRVANSLQIIASVLMQSARRATNDEARDYLKIANNRVLSVVSIQKHLSATGSDDVALRPYFTQLCQSISASMIVFPEELSITVDCDDTIVRSATSISLGLIVTELVINSLKHGFSENIHGTISVSYQTNDTGWTLLVRDDGIGMPVKASKAKAGLGTSIVEALARQLQAEITVSDAHPGTSVSIAHKRPENSDAEAMPLVQAI